MNLWLMLMFRIKLSIRESLCLNAATASLTGTERTPVGLYCGDDVFVGFLYGPPSGSIFLQFHTDHSEIRQGFKFEYKASSEYTRSITT